MTSYSMKLELSGRMIAFFENLNKIINLLDKVLK